MQRIHQLWDMNEKRSRFHKIYPDQYFLDADNLDELEKYLNSKALLQPDEVIQSCSIPGAGNMNYVIRVTTNQRSFVLKQSRPWVEKYPQIDAPIERINIEAQYYDATTRSEDLSKYSAKIYLHDPANFILIMEDLGDVKDFTYLYEEDQYLDQQTLKSLLAYLDGLHATETPDFPDNIEMRRLNHEHIFNYPFVADNGFNLDDIQEGLSALAVNETTDPELVQLIRNTGEEYLKNGAVLLHGDFYPGSWMKSEALFVLDPEFAFQGPREFDLGVLVAHLLLSQHEETTIHSAFDQYEKYPIDQNLLFRFAGIEVLRRLLGVAQLPLNYSVAQKEALINKAKAWIVG